MILGLDGLNLRLVQALLPPEVCPTLRRLLAEGASGKLRSVFPTHSAAAWASFMTGQTPARHGVLDFLVRGADGRYRHARPDPRHTLWRYLGAAGYRGGVFNFPVTFPPDPIPGWMVSGMLTPDTGRLAAPAALGQALLRHLPDYQIDVEWKVYAGREAQLAAALTRLVRQRAAAADFLLRQMSLDYAAIAFVAPDRLQHALWRYLDPTHPHYRTEEAEQWQPTLHTFYQALDEAVAQLLEHVGPATTLMVLSDHGFQPAVWQFHLNDWLAQMGWLRYAAGRVGALRRLRDLETPRLRRWRHRWLGEVTQRWPGLSHGMEEAIDWQHTAAYCPWSFQQGVRLNIRGRDPAGSVPPGEPAARLLAELQTALLTLREPTSGTAVVRAIYQPQEVYEADALTGMPDLILELHPPFALGVYQARNFAPIGFASADHALDGLVALHGPGIAPGSAPPTRLIDIAPTVAKMFNLPVPNWMSGVAWVRPAGAGEINFVQPTLPVEQTGEMGETGDLTPEEEAAVMERLRHLGYR